MEERDRVGEDEVRSFADKLNDWGGSLNLGEKALLQLILERAAGRGAESAEEADFSFPATKGFGDVVTPFLREIVASGALTVQPPEVPMMRVRGWVQAGDPWVRGT